MRIAKKYEFLRKADALRYVNELWIEDENGERKRKTYTKEVQDESGSLIQKEFEYIAHPVVLGNIVIEQGQYDEEGNELVAPVLSSKFHIDVLWESEVEPRWQNYEIQVEGKGVHEFK